MRVLFVQLCAVIAAIAGSTLSGPVQAMPGFARQYEVSCNLCHSAVPRLSAFGEVFRDDLNMRMPNWKEKALSAGDDKLALPTALPIGIRAQAFVQGRQGEDIDPVSGPTGNDSSFDFQAPYLIKLITSAPLSDQITFYAYGIFAEKGENGTVLIEDAWFSYGDLFGSGVSAQLGQFQVSDVMFPRETRLTFQDFQVYRMAGVTYERGVLLGRALGPIDIDFGVVNGNGIEANINVDSPGYRRPDRMFDNDDGKSAFLHLGTKFGSVSAGAFGLSGEQRSVAGAAGQLRGNRDVDRRVYGIDLSGQRGLKTHWYAQALWMDWENFLDADPARNVEWFGAFAGVDYIQSDRWTFSALYNYNDARDFKGTQTIFEGIDMSALTIGASYYFMRNVKGVIEVNADFLSKDRDSNFVGHESRESYLLLGFDAAY